MYVLLIFKFLSSFLAWRGGSIGRSVTNAGIPMLNRNDRRYWRWNVDGGGGCARRVAGRNTVLNTAHAVTDTDGKKEETSHTHTSRIHLYDHEM